MTHTTNHGLSAEQVNEIISEINTATKFYHSDVKKLAEGDSIHFGRGYVTALERIKSIIAKKLAENTTQEKI